MFSYGGFLQLFRPRLIAELRVCRRKFSIVLFSILGLLIITCRHAQRGSEIGINPKNIALLVVTMVIFLGGSLFTNKSPVGIGQRVGKCVWYIVGFTLLGDCGMFT